VAIIERAEQLERQRHDDSYQEEQSNASA